MAAVDESKSLVLYNVTVSDLKDELNILEADLQKTPPLALRSLQFAESELTKTYDSFLTHWSNSQSALETTELDQAYRDHRALKRNAWSVLTQVKSLIDEHLSRLGQSQVSQSPNPSSVVVPVKHLPHPSMPEIKIPDFNGQLKHWKNFWDSFSSLIDSRQDIDPVVKFNLLKHYLKDRAYKTIEGLAVTNDNYSVAVKLLKSRFADDKFVLQKLHLELMNLKPPGHNFTELSDFSLAFERLLLEIEGINKVPCDDYLFKDIIVKKLNPETLEFLFNKYNTYDLTLDQLTKGIGHIVKSMQRSHDLSDQSVKSKSKETSSFISTSKPNVNQSTNSSPSKFSTISKQAVVSSQNQSQKSSGSNSTIQKWNKPCLFCSEIHNTKFCANYPTHESRRNRIRDLDVCFVCMKKGHRASDCTITAQCRVCSGKHHTFLCMKLTNRSTAVNQVTVTSNPPTVVTNSGSNTSSVNPTNSVSVDDDKHRVLLGSSISVVNNCIQTDLNNQMIPLRPIALPTAKGKVSGAGVREVVRIFLDSGAQRTFIHTALARRLKLKPLFRTSLRMVTFGNQIYFIWCDVVRVIVRLGTQRITVFAFVYDEVNTTVHVPGIAKVAETLRNKGVKLADPDINSDTLTDIGLVIGADYFTRILSNRSFHSGVSLMSSAAGSVIIGPMPKWAIDTESVNLVHVQEVFCARVGVQIIESELDQISNLWSLDIVGIKPETLTPEESQSVHHFESTCQKLGNQYFVELPFKNDERPPTNYRKSYGQLMSLSKSFATRPELFEQYSKIFNEYIDLGFIEKVDKPFVVDGLSHYLPHHPVYKNSPTTPIRVVFNASSRSDADSKSLNDCLLTGPTLTSKLVDSLVEFRTNPVAVVSDISKAFLRIGILHKDRDFCRFLFFEDETLQKVITYRFCVVLFGATSSPFLLQKTLTHHLETHSHPLAKSLISHFYVDNFSCTYSDLDQLRDQYPLVNSILSEASMPLQCWVSNNATFNDEIGVDHENLDLFNVNVLGISWNTVSDEISLHPGSKVCKEECLHHPHKITKRIVVSVISSVFDPIGLLSPVLVKGKLYIKKLWNLDYTWDEVISEPLAQEFQNICKDLSQVSNIQYPRFVITPGISNLHIFCDSSQSAYGLAVYAINSEDKSSNLLMSKTRVAPSPQLTIPKLELLALTFASRLAQTLLSNEKLAFRNCTLWCDSEVAINWVYHNKSSEVFVRNRVSEIRTLRSKFDLNILHVPSKENPADILTRGVNVLQLSNSLQWKHGPSFLLNPSEYPPQKDFIVDTTVVSEILVEPHVVEPILPQFDMSKYSSLTKVTRIMACIMQFCNAYFPDKFELNALHACIRLAQLQSFPTLFAYLEQPDRSPRPAAEVLNLVKQLDLYLNDDHLITSASRLQNSDLSPEAQFPIYLPAKHHLTKLIIIHYHRLHHHCGLGQMLSILRAKFWISKCRVIIKNVLKSCILCKKAVGKTISQPGPPPLPEERVKYVRPFSSVGVDFTGSISIFDPTTTDVSEKVYVCLFTCCTSRAVHLELCSSLSTLEFILAFRRFASRFGVPSVVFSDNGTNFRGAERFLHDISDEPEVVSYMQNNNILWKFNTPRSPWSGGFFERLIGCVKSSLHKSLYKKRVSFNELRTILCEIECVVNSRPLTYLSEDIREDYLTPSHLIYGRTVTLFPPLNSFGADVPYGESLDLRVQYARLSSILKKYEKVWMESYLTSLRERHLTCAKDKPCQVQIGDLVLIVMENRMRSSYPLGLVTQLIRGTDDIVRSVVLHTADAEYVRPLSKLIPLELHQEIVPEVQPVDPPNPPIVPDAPPRPRRCAARRAEQLRRDLIADSLL